MSYDPGSQWVAKGPSFLQADLSLRWAYSVMRRLIWLGCVRNFASSSASHEHSVKPSLLFFQPFIF